jgi:type IV pilus modification protein PilV
MRNHSGSGRASIHKLQRGFTLVEVMISIVILTVGLVALLGVMVKAMAATQTAQQDMIAKQLASEAMESVFTARDTANIQWVQIQNVGAGTIPDGIFVTNFQPINNAGADGIYGTADDAVAGAQTIRLPGPDGLLNTADDILTGLTNYKRQIVITPVISGGATLSNLRLITITIQYTTSLSSQAKQYVLSGYISQYQ